MCLECMFTVPGETTMVSNVLGPVDAWIARTHDFITRRGGRAVVFNPSHPRLRGTVHRFLRITPECRRPYKGHGSRMRSDGLSGIRTHGILLAKEALCR